MQDLLKEIEVNGHAVLNGSHLVQLINIDDIEFGRNNGSKGEHTPITNVKLVKHALSIIHHELYREFIEPCNKNYKISQAKQIWESSPEHHKLWHNDSYEETNDMFFLLYFTDQRPTDDGAIHFKNDIGEHRYVPYPGLLIAVENSNPKWLHQVEPATSKRVVACLGFKIDKE